MKRKNSRLLVGILVAITVFTVAGLPAFSPLANSPAQAATPAKLSKELNILNWSEYLPQSIIKKFEKEYKVKVNYDTYSSNEELFAKLQAGANNYDLIVPSDYMVDIMIKQKLLAPLDKANLSNIKNIDPKRLNFYFDKGNKYTVPYMWGTVGIAYNSKKITTPPKSWADLWNPRYKGKVVMLNDSREVIGAGLQLLGYSKNETDPKKLAAAKARIKELMPSVKAFDSDSPKTLFLNGEVWIGQTWSGEAAIAYQQDPAVKFVLPKEGGGSFQDNMAIPKGAPHKYTAEVFINFLLRPEVSLELSRAFPYGNPNKAAFAIMPENLKKNPASYPPDAAVAKTEWNKDVGQATTLFDQIWTEVKGGQ